VNVEEKLTSCRVLSQITLNIMFLRIIIIINLFVNSIMLFMSENKYFTVYCLMTLQLVVQEKTLNAVENAIGNTDGKFKYYRRCS
jgi:hypothetical protein